MTSSQQLNTTTTTIPIFTSKLPTPPNINLKSILFRRKYWRVCHCSSRLCEFVQYYGALKEKMIRDRIVCGITNSGIRKKLLQIPDLTYDKCMDVCRAAEATKTQLNDMKTNKSTYLSNGDMENRPEWRYCGRQHNRGRSYCPAFGKLCAKSGKMNHFLAKCLSSRRHYACHTRERHSKDFFHNEDWMQTSENARWFWGFVQC